MATSYLSARNARHRRAPRHQAQRRGQIPWWTAVVLLLGLTLLVLEARPRIRLEASPNALAQVALHGWDTHLMSASLKAGSGPSRSLRVERGSLWPTQSLPPGQVVRVRAVVSGLLGWSVDRQWTLRTPLAPQMESDRLSVDVGDRPTAVFTEPVAQARFPDTGMVMNVGGRTRVALSPRVESPDRQGSVMLQVHARSWERWSPARQVHWTSVPWLTAAAVLVKAGHPNLSTAPIKVTFSVPVRRADTTQWTIAPAVPGGWHRVTHRIWEFQPRGAGWAPDTTIHVQFPTGARGPYAEDGASLSPASTALTVQLPQGTTLRLQQWLAQLGYLPLHWTASANAGRSGWDSVYQPPAGRFVWRYAAIPAALRALWNPTYWTAMTQAAVIAFQKQQHLPVNGIPGPAVWTALQRAVVRHAVTHTPYAYVYVSETLPERLWLWVGGQVVLSTLANTGIPQTPTLLGSYAVDERRVFQVMRGTNPNGTPYADPVHWINYFDKSQAVHGFQRAQYGFPQSLGCVEVPIPVAQHIYPHLYIGALVTVAPPGSSPLVPSAAAAGLAPPG